VRVTPQERDLLEAAALQSRTTLSDFVRRKALEAAELDLLERRIVTIPTAAWEKVEAWVSAPSQPNPALRDFAAAKPAWQG
jgi:uncharacterized protein (DUF1778 family)